MGYMNTLTLLDYKRLTDDKVLEYMKDIIKSGERSDKGYALKQCAERGYEESVKYLLTFKDVDVNYLGGEPLYNAALNKRYKVVEMLLNDKRVRVSPEDSFSIEMVIKDDKIYELFRKSGKLTPTVINSLTDGAQNTILGRKMGKFKDLLDIQGTS